jgi:methylmalonyl-CoA epimerase
MLTRIDHIGIAVSSINEALQFFDEALGLNAERTELEEGGRTRVAFMPVGAAGGAGDAAPLVELVEPQEQESGLAKFIAKRGEGVHHICFEVDDIMEALRRLKEHGAQLIDETPRQNATGQRYAFIHPKSAHGVLIELYEKGT